MHQGLHLVAIAFTAIATCIHLRERRAADPLRTVTAALMLVAMVDAVYIRLLAPVLWTTILLVAALALAAVRSPRRLRTAVAVRCDATHDALGLVALAALLTLMPVAAGTDAHDHTGHGVSPALLTTVVLAVAASHGVASLIACARDKRALERVQYVLMGGATLLMAGAAIA